jgi:hypothetical protein
MFRIRSQEQVITAGHDLGQKDGDLQLRATLLREDPVRNAELGMTAEKNKTPEMARLSNEEKYLDKTTYNLTAIN